VQTVRRDLAQLPAAPGDLQLRIGGLYVKNVIDLQLFKPPFPKSHGRCGPHLFSFDPSLVCGSRAFFGPHPLEMFIGIPQILHVTEDDRRRGFMLRRQHNMETFGGYVAEFRINTASSLMNAGHIEPRSQVVPAPFEVISTSPQLLCPVPKRRKTQLADPGRQAAVRKLFPNCSQLDVALHKSLTQLFFQLEPFLAHTCKIGPNLLVVRVDLFGRGTPALLLELFLEAAKTLQGLKRLQRPQRRKPFFSPQIKLFFTDKTFWRCCYIL